MGNALFTASDPLTFAPPARHLHRIGGIVDIDDLQDVTVIAHRQTRGIDVSAAVVVIAMRASTAGFEMTDCLGTLGIGQVPDQKSFGVGLAGRAAPARRYAFQR